MDLKWWVDYLNQPVRVWVKGRKLKNGIGVHHFIACEGIGDCWRVAEWGTLPNSEPEYYATKRVEGFDCHNLGNYCLRDVFNATKKVSLAKPYGINNNCNEWTEQVAYDLNHNIVISWDCLCINQ